MISVTRSSIDNRYIPIRLNEPQIHLLHLALCRRHHVDMRGSGSDSIMRRWRCQADDGCARLATIGRSTRLDCIPAHDTHTQTQSGRLSCSCEMNLVTHVTSHLQARSNELILICQFVLLKVTINIICYSYYYDYYCLAVIAQSV